jgi:3-phenylpropionate/trans-cinnamate dioxygenase ferredoxin component
MPELIELTTVDQVPLGAVKRFEVNDLAVAVVHTEEGIFAIEDRCSHADVALSEGELDGCLLECWLHGSAFDVRTGEPQSLPALTPVATFAVTADLSNPQSPISITI